MKTRLSDTRVHATHIDLQIAGEPGNVVEEHRAGIGRSAVVGDLNRLKVAGDRIKPVNATQVVVVVDGDVRRNRDQRRKVRQRRRRDVIVVLYAVHVGKRHSLSHTHTKDTHVKVKVAIDRR